MARNKRPIDAPAIAPGDDGVQDLKKRLSPPSVWKYESIWLGWPDEVESGWTVGLDQEKEQGPGGKCGHLKKRKLP